MIIKGILEKKSEKNVTWSERFCVMTGRDFRYYYTELHFKNDATDFLGSIPLKSIYGILPLNEREKGNKVNAF